MSFGMLFQPLVSEKNKVKTDCVLRGDCRSGKSLLRSTWFPVCTLGTGTRLWFSGVCGGVY